VFLRICLSCAILFAITATGLPQTRSSNQRRGRKPAIKAQTNPEPAPTPPVEEKTQPTPEPSPLEEEQELEKVKVDTDLVTIPVISTTIQRNYIPDLRQEEFNISEDGAKQEIAFFATVSAPFHVVLLLDTSASAEEKLASIRRAAAAFVDQLQPRDQVKVISFDNELRELSDFTSNRSVLRAAIYQTRSGTGTKLYDAVELALASIRPIQGRKAIVLFSDGVDWHSDMASFDSSLHNLDEEGVIVYPIRYETRAEAERIARESSNEPGLPTRDVLQSPGTTPPTVPSDDPITVPTSTQRRTGPWGLPTADEILRGRRNPDRDRLPPTDRLPPGDPTGRPNHDPGEVGGRPGSTTRPDSRGGRRSDDSIGLLMDNLYMKADSYLLELANKSGGRILRADTLGSLPDAFAKIAAELRTQYAIGYYPTNKAHDGQYRKVKVTTTRKDVVIRARPGYRARSGG
jgi:von Willebrand factor type A domain